MTKTLTIKQNINLPKKSFFTLFDVFALNPDAKEITLRFKVSKLIESKEIHELGYLPRPVGRPRKIFTQNNISKALLDAAKRENIVIKEGITVS